MWLSVGKESTTVKLGTVDSAMSQISMDFKEADFKPLETIAKAELCSITMKTASDEWTSHVPIRSTCPSHEMKAGIVVNIDSDLEGQIRQVTSLLDGATCIGTVSECIAAAKNARLSVSKPHQGSKPTVEKKRLLPGQDPSKLDAEKPEEQSFIQKYWIYILLFFVITMVNGGEQQPVQEGQDQQPAAQSKQTARKNK